MSAPEAYQTWETVFTNAKAGMAQVDRDHVKKIVWEASQGSAHFANEQRKQAAVQAKIATLKRQAEQLNNAQLASHTAACDSYLASLEATRDLTRLWLHIDMDAFFASVEERDAPHLRNVPMAVGGIGMISTANYEARKFGVRSAMPGFIGRKLCPSLVFVSPTFSKYTAASAAVRDVVAQFDPRVEMSLDEAYLDVTEYAAAHTLDAAQVAQRVRGAVHEATGLTCSVGVAPNRMLAKVCSDLNKPNGQYVLPSQRAAVQHFVTTLPIRKIPGVGKVTEQMLRALGISTCADLLTHRAMLRALFSKLTFDFFMSSALGFGSTCHAPPPRDGEAGRKGISCERTFRPMSTRAELEAKCSELVKHLAEDMAVQGLRGRTLTLKLKTVAFEVRTRAATLPTHTSDMEVMRDTALRLLRRELPVQLRLMGVRMSGFLETAAPVGQRTLDAFVQGPAGAGPTRATPMDDGEQPRTDEQESELPTLGDWVEGSGGTPVELSFGDWHPSQPSGSGGTWSCDACTYADNAAGAPCCEVCGKTRGVPWAAAPEEDEGLVRCDTCGKMVAQEDSVEHGDWHLAVALQKGEEAVERRRPGKRQQQTKLDSYMNAGVREQRRRL